MIYSDGIHLISDTSLEELHEFCSQNQIKKCWFHSSSKFPHYDIPKKKRKDFFLLNPSVLKVSSRDIVRILQKLTKF